MNRSIGVTFIGVLSLIGSVLMLGMAVMMVAIAVFSPRTDTNIPPGVFLILMVVCSIFYAMLAAWGISTSIGLFRLKNWARISIIIFSVLLTLMSTISGLMALTIPLPPTAGTPVDPNAMLIFRMVMGIFWAVQMGIGIWWLVFFTRAKVKAQFVPPALPKTLPQGAGYSLQKANLQVPPANRPPERPVSITVIACLLLGGCLFIPMNVVMHTPAVFFTKILFGWTAATVFLAFTVIHLYLGIGLLRLQPTARMVGIVYFVFATSNSVVFFLAPGAKARMAALLEWQKSFLTFGQLSSISTQMQFDPTPFYFVGFFVGVAAAAVQIYFLVTRKAAFDKVVRADAVT